MVTKVTTGKAGAPGVRWLRGRAFWATVVAAFWLALLLGIVGTYSPLDWTWTGFRDNGNLWSWLQLLSAPVFLAALPLVIKDAGDRHGELGHEPVQGAEERRQAQEAYQSFILDLMLNKNLGSTDCGQDVRQAARVRTLAALRGAGADQKCEILQFVYQAGLVDRHMSIVKLFDADLSSAMVSGVTLSGSDLTGADLSNAILRGTDLSGTCLSNARLTGADLTDADLSGACLEGAVYSQEQLSPTRRWP